MREDLFLRVPKYVSVPILELREVQLENFEDYRNILRFKRELYGLYESFQVYGITGLQENLEDHWEGLKETSKVYWRTKKYT